jgi:hypothetical protein
MSNRSSKETRGEASFAPDRRSLHRYPFVAAAELVEVKTGVKVSAQTVSLSPKGCYLGTTSPFPEGTIVRVRLINDASVFETEGEVVSVHAESGMNILFRDLTPEQQKVLESWLAKLRS